MAKKIYAVALDSPSSLAEERLRSTYSQVFKQHDNLLLVVGNASDVSEDIAVAAGIKGDERAVAGVVFRLNGSYSGYTKRTLWEWLGDVSREEAE